MNLLEKIEEIIRIFSYPEKDTDLQEEYVRLFINDFEGKKASPYAFDYFNDCSSSNFFLNLRKLYFSAGLEINPDFKEREDHLVVLLEFLGYLIEVEVPEKYIKKFVDNYLFWIPEFVKKIKKSTDNFYFLKGADLLEELYENIKNNRC